MIYSPLAYEWTALELSPAENTEGDNEVFTLA